MKRWEKFLDDAFEDYRDKFAAFMSSGACDGILCEICPFYEEVDGTMRYKCHAAERRDEYLTEVDDEL